MIIDAHAHLYDDGWLPEWGYNLMYTMIARRLKTSFERAKEIRQESWDSSGDRFVKNMDQSGVDKAVVWAIDWGMVDNLDDSLVPIEKQNYLLYQATKRHPERLAFGVGVDPRRTNAIDIVEEAVKKYGAKGLKLYPACGYYPHDRILYPLYQKCVELKIPVAWHVGPSFGPLRSKYGHPMHIDDVAADFPDLTIIAFHAGYEAYHELLYVAHHRPNVVCDLAGWSYWTIRPLHFYQTLRFLIDKIGSERIMFASDWAAREEAGLYTKWVESFTEITSFVKEIDIEFIEEEISNILSDNAIRILQLL